MSKAIIASQEALVVQAVREAAKPADGQTLAWAKLSDIQALLPNIPDLLQQLQRMAAQSTLAMTFEWGDHRLENRAGTNPIVGYCKDKPLFRVL